MNCDNRHIVWPCKYQDVKNSVGPPKKQELLDLPSTEQTVERWRVANHERENPLLYGSHLLLALAVEHVLGRTDALPALELAVASIGQLYKFGQIAEFAGYPIRWDAVTSDKWVTRNVAGKGAPWYCCEFLIDQNYQHSYCTPFNHPGYVPFDPSDPNDDRPSRFRSFDLYRRWEPSMDELVGLVLSYDFVYALVDSPSIRAEIQRQVNNLSSYLRRHGYLLVRPCGGFTARGASGALPALEYPFSRIFARITGQLFPASASFEQALVAAGLWDCLKPSMQRWGVAGAAILGILLSALGSLLVQFLGGAVGLLLGGVSGYNAGRAFGVFQARNCFDVWRESARQEFVAAYLLKLLPARQRFLLWINNVWRGQGYAKNFAQFIGLTALQDGSDTSVKDAYLNSLPAAKKDKRGTFGNTGFAAAVAVVLGYAGEEPSLRKFLDDAYDSFAGPDRLRQPMLRKDSEVLAERIRNDGDEVPEDPLGALEYMACLALSWLRAKRLQDSGTPADPDRIVSFPKMPAAWPQPTVPSKVIEDGVVPGLTGLTAGQDVPLFSTPQGELSPDERRRSDSPPSAPPVVSVDQQTISVPEASALVDPGIVIRLGDKVVINASGTIWAGVWLTGRNGPEGWSGISTNPKFPARGTNPYCLLYKVVPSGADAAASPWRKLGATLSFTAMTTTTTGTILFRTNDDTPGNGNGGFSCDIIVERVAP